MTKKRKSDVVRVAGEQKTVPLEDVRPNTYNYNKQSPFVLEKMIQSLREFGFVDPIVTRSGNDEGEFGYYEIVGGEHRHIAASELGYTELPIIDLGCIPDAQAKKLCIVLNETKGKPDQDALAALVSDLNDSGADLDVLPYDEKELDSMIELGGMDLDELLDEEPEFEDESHESAPKATLIGTMGLLDISKKKEQYLIDQYVTALRVSGHANNPIRLLEKMLVRVIEKGEV